MNGFKQPREKAKSSPLRVLPFCTQEGAPPDTLEFLNRSGERVPLPRRTMTELIARLARAQGRARQPLAVLFTGDAEMKTYHRRYLGKSKCTDVLSFPAGEPDFPCETQRLGDLIISLPAVRRQAARLGHARARELAYLLLHGFLHLCGYDHESDELAWADAELRLGRLVNHLLPPGWQHRALGMLGEP